MRNELPYTTQTYIYIHLMEYILAKIVGHDDACHGGCLCAALLQGGGVGEREVKKKEMGRGERMGKERGRGRRRQGGVICCGRCFGSSFLIKCLFLVFHM